MYYNFPLKIDSRGQTTQVEQDLHIRQLIEQLLFTEIGERPNRPTFGTGFNQLIFALNSEELAASTGILIQTALQQWLGDLIEVTSVETNSIDSSFQISIQYVIRKTQRSQRVNFSREV